MHADAQFAALLDALKRAVESRHRSLVVGLRLAFSTDVRYGLAVPDVGYIGTLFAQFANRAIGDVEQRTTAQRHGNRKSLLAFRQRRQRHAFRSVLAQRDVVVEYRVALRRAAMPQPPLQRRAYSESSQP